MNLLAALLGTVLISVSANDASVLFAKHAQYAGWKAGDPSVQGWTASGTRTNGRAADAFTEKRSGVAYRDTTANNEGKQYRTNVGVDIEKSADSGGGYDVGYLKQGEWLDYTVNVTKAGTFNFYARVASPYSGAAFHVEIDGKNVTGSIAFTNTGNFQKWSTLRKTGIKIAAGKHIVRVVVDSSAGHKYAGNLNWFKFS